MRISEKTWLDYINRLGAVDKTATNKMRSYIGKRPSILLGDDVEDLIEYAYGISTTYGEAAAALACEMYDNIAELSGVNLDPAEPAEPAEYGEVAKAVYGTYKMSSEIVEAAIGRLVKRTGVDTTMKNAIRDHAEWAWIPYGDTCAFCITLASRGWQYATKEALRGGHADHIHSHCDCSYAVRFNESTKYSSYDPEVYLDMYYGAEGKNSKDRINSLRRDLYAENKDKINAQKREAYRKRQERNND